MERRGLLAGLSAAGAVASNAGARQCPPRLAGCGKTRGNLSFRASARNLALKLKKNARLFVAFGSSLRLRSGRPSNVEAS